MPKAKLGCLKEVQKLKSKVRRLR